MIRWSKRWSEKFFMLLNPKGREDNQDNTGAWLLCRIQSKDPGLRKSLLLAVLISSFSATARISTTLHETYVNPGENLHAT